MLKRTVKLAEPFELHKKTIDTIALNEPRGGLYAKLGEPRILVHTASGGYYIEREDTIRLYLEACVDNELGADVIGMLSLVDAKAVKDELLSFFSEADAKLAAKKLASSLSPSTRSPSTPRTG